MILSGEKTHTIRARRAHPDKPGNPMYLYTGLRTKYVQKLFATVCTRVEDIRLEGADKQGPRIFIEGIRLANDECEQLARRDGFADIYMMSLFWHGRLPFDGHIIHWRYPKEAQ
jgi:hypothetical protein